MNIDISLFYIFAGFIIFFTYTLIQSKNPVYSVLSLIMCFVNTAALLLMLELDFLAMIFLVVYVGAIAVLFLFVVMMINIKVEEVYNVTHLFPIYLPLGMFIGIIFVFEVLVIINNDLVAPSFAILEYLTLLDKQLYLTPHWYIELGSVGLPQKGSLNNNTSINVFGLILYVYHFYYFLLASIILLVGMISAIVLTMHQETTVKRQEIYKQNLRGSTSQR